MHTYRNSAPLPKEKKPPKILKNVKNTGYSLPPAHILNITTPLGEIIFDYTYYRLAHKRYSGMEGNNVSYTYHPGGRIESITDGTGTRELGYDALGNVTHETRTVALPGNGRTLTFTHTYEYDSWGRMLTMTYPDGEQVDYTYRWGGDLFSVHGAKGADSYRYVDSIAYNALGQRSRVEYGNGATADYTYDTLHRLARLESRDSLGRTMQDIAYTFDSAGNITGIANAASAIGTLGGQYANTYAYDPLHRLVGASGGGAAAPYALLVQYSPSGRLLGRYTETPQGTSDRHHGHCDDLRPHAPRRVLDKESGLLHDLRWDEAGNLGQVSMAGDGGMCETARFLLWTEDNRLHTVADDRHHSYYAYDHAGERTLKLTGYNNLLDVNADCMATHAMLKNPTLYPSPYIVLSNHGYTKHYYAGAERIAARIGGGGLEAPGDGPTDDNDRADLLFGQSLDHANSRHLEENDPDCIPDNAEGISRYIEEIPQRLQADVSVDLEDFRAVMRHYSNNNSDPEPEVYFYHSDHLGSASWITDANGTPVQHLQYLPFGEPYINQRVGDYSERFTFTGKERDEETGYGYFGARYMDHELMTMWLSVDPLADKYPSISPYAYCAWNPVKLVDPDGRDIWEINGEGKVINHIKDKTKDAFYMVDDNGKRIKGDGASIEFKYGTITDSKRATLINRAISFSVNSESAGAELFRFFADNTQIEYGLINTENCGSVVMTNHKRSSVSATITAKKMSEGGQIITSIVHNHPGNSDPSGFNKGDKDGDRFAASTFTKSHGRVINYYVYTPKNGKLIQYDEHMIFGGRSWGSVFKPSSARINPSTRSFPGVGLPPR